jgi:uncharacterized phage-associated protein
MASVRNVAQYIIEKRGRVTTWKLQKLVYYAQAWSLVWDEKRLFPERIEAWANGPVVPDLYSIHRGNFTITKVSGGNATKLSGEQRETVDAVLDAYADKPSQRLRDLTHREPPWINARRRAGLSEGERGNSEITVGDMADYYGNL